MLFMMRLVLSFNNGLKRQGFHQVTKTIFSCLSGALQPRPRYWVHIQFIHIINHIVQMLPPGERFYKTCSNNVKD